MDFWEKHEQAWWATLATPKAQTAGEPAATTSRQGDTSGVCEFCGFAGEDVLLGVCADCAADDEGSRS